MHRVKLVPLLVILLFLQACLTPSYIEEIAIINSRGIDLVEGEDGSKLIETTIIPYVFDPEAMESTNILIGRGHTIKEARESAGTHSSYRLSPGKINIEIYGKEAAETGILPLLNTLIRDARVSDRMQLAVTNQTARELLETEQEVVNVNTVEYIQDLIEKEVEQGVLPRNTLEYFTRLGEQIGIDPVLPVIDLIEGIPTLNGAALFHQDKYVGAISIREAFMITLTRRRISGTPAHAQIPLENYKDLLHNPGDMDAEDESLYLFLSNTRGRTTIKLMDEDALTYQAEVRLKAELPETSVPLEVKSQEISDQMEKDIEAYIKEVYENLFAKLQEVGSDAFGLGRVYSATRKGSHTTHKEWEEKFQEATIEFDVDFTLTNYGTID